MSRNQKKFSKGNFSRNKDRMLDASHQQNFIFNKTPILASALKKLKTKSSTSAPKQLKRTQPIQIQQHQPNNTNKKIKKNPQNLLPQLSYSPLQKDLYNFFTINKIALKNFEFVPQPKFQIGSTILAALCDRGIGGKFLVANIFRNKKCYIDYNQISLYKNQKKNIQVLEKYNQPGSFIVGTVVQGRTPTHVQLSMSTFLTIDEKNIKVGQTFPAQIKSKQQLGCHLIVHGIQKYKVFLSKASVDQEDFKQFVEDKQIIVVVKEIQEKNKIIKVSLAEDQQLTINFKGLEENDLSKMELDQYVAPGTLINTKIVKILRNGVMVKFLKIFVGFIHQDHLNKNLQSYAVGQKLQARMIFYCVNPPTLFLSEKHVDLSTYQPKRPLFSELNQPQKIQQRQKAFFNRNQQFFVHPSQLHTIISQIPKFYVKQNNYFERYQIMSSKKIGVQVGQVTKFVPFTNFKIFGEKQNKQGHKFRVMCIDMWNKVIKISYDQKIIKASKESLLFDIDKIDENKKYIGFISSMNPNGVVVEFCNNIRGIITKNELNQAEIVLKQQNIGESLELYVNKIKKSYLGLTLRHPEMRNNNNKQTKSQNKKNETQQFKGQSTQMGTITSVNTKSIYPIYIKIKNRMAKISVFDGIRPPSIAEAHVITNLEDHYKVGQNVRVFRKGKQYFLYPPEQMKDKDLRYCRILGIKGSHIRVQTGDKQFMNSHITNITDIITPYPLSEYKVGEFTIGRVLQKNQICLRKSIVQYGIPKSMQEVIRRYNEQQKKGDLRNRLLTIGSSSLKNQMICFGYIKTTTQKGCFVSLAYNYQVRVQRCELSDTHVVDKEKQFKSNKLVLLRLISSKVKTNEPNKFFFDASLRESVIKHGYPINDEILQHGVGMTVEGAVKGYAKGKALIQLHSSKFTGIIGMKDIEDLGDQSLEKALPIGKTLKLKVIQYLYNGQNRLIRLSNLQKYFLKYKGFQTTFPIDERIVSLWESFKNLQSIEMPEQQKQINVEEENLEDEEQRIMKMLGGINEDQKMDVEEQQEQEMAEEQQQDEQEQEENDQEEEQEQISQQQGQQVNPQQQKKKNKTQHDQFRKRTAMFQKMPHEPSFYHSLVLANPTPQSWLMYISSLLNTSTPQQIRAQFLKAIHSFSEIKDKDNMWISWINMQMILGDFQGTVKKAIQNSVGLNVYSRILQVLAQRQQWQVALEFGRKMLKKFNKQIKAYIQFLKMINQYSHNHQVNESFTPKNILKRAGQSLKSHEVITIESHMAKYMFENKQQQKGRNIFEQLLSKNPKRTDLWSMYVDLQIKANEIDKSRNLLQRVLALNLNKKLTKSILKKYYTLQQQHGTQKSANAILARAKKLAQQFVQGQQANNQQEQQQDEQ